MMVDLGLKPRLCHIIRTDRDIQRFRLESMKMQAKIVSKAIQELGLWCGGRYPRRLRCRSKLATATARSMIQLGRVKLWALFLRSRSQFSQATERPCILPTWCCNLARLSVLEAQHSDLSHFSSEPPRLKQSIYMSIHNSVSAAQIEF